MKKLCMLLLGAGAIVLAQDAAPQADRVLFDTGLRFETQQQPEKARLLLRTLTLAYPDSPLTPQANRELAALTLFLSAESDLADGRLQRAELSLQTLLNTFPTSPLAPEANKELAAIALFQTAQPDVTNGRAKRAELTLQTMVNTYPASALAPRAEAILKTIR
jgi:hypothetical protein